MTLSAMSLSMLGMLNSESSLELVSEEAVSCELLSEELVVVFEEASLEEVLEPVEVEVDDVVLDELVVELLLELELVPEDDVWLEDSC